jgi:D-3-phosphoglycerate dehydrogenase
MVTILDGASVAIVGDDELSKQVLQSCKSLELIVRWGAGTDNVDLDYARQLGIKVVNTPGLFGEDVADLALGHALNLVRGLSRFDRAIRVGGWDKETSPSMRSLTFSVLGYGAVGREIAKLLQAFNSEISVFDPALTGEVAIEGMRVATSVANALEDSNLVFIAMPLTNETRGILGKSEILKLATPRYLVNVSRGEILKQEEVFDALDAGLLQGLGMDVFEVEPIQTGMLPARVSNAFFTSHNASNTFMSISRANARVDDILKTFLPPRGLS